MMRSAVWKTSVDAGTMTNLEAGIQDLALQGSIPAIRGDPSRPYVTPLKGLPCCIVGLQLFGQFRQEVSHVDATKGLPACLHGTKHQASSDSVKAARVLMHIYTCQSSDFPGQV